MKSYRIADMDYFKSDTEELRNEVIALRDEALKQGDMYWAITLSHVIAFMAVALEEMYKEEVE